MENVESRDVVEAIIGDDDVKMRPRFHAFGEFFDGVFSRIFSDDFMTRTREHHLRHFEEIDFVIDEENSSHFCRTLVRFECGQNATPTI